jgi:Zn-dependent protease with chaperone function
MDDGLELGIDLGESEGGSVFPAARSKPQATLATASKALKAVPIRDCISRDERKKRIGVALINSLIWMVLALFAFATMGLIVLAYGFTWLIKELLAEYNVRKLQALGTEATEGQFPEIIGALRDACSVLGIRDLPKVVVVNLSEINAFAVKFARKKVIVLLSETLEGVLDQPDQLRFFLGHELGHVVLDHGKRGWFELYKPASYKAAREMTCDNCGCAAAGNQSAAKEALKRLAVGNELYPRLSESFLAEEARYIYSGITGWLIKQYLTYPPLGKRLMNVEEFALQTQGA